MRSAAIVSLRAYQFGVRQFVVIAKLVVLAKLVIVAKLVVLARAPTAGWSVRVWAFAQVPEVSRLRLRENWKLLCIFMTQVYQVEAFCPYEDG